MKYLLFLAVLLTAKSTYALDLICDYNGSQMAPAAACGAYQTDNLITTSLKSYSGNGYTYNQNLADDFVGSVSVSCQYNVTNYYESGSVASQRTTTVGISCNTAPACTPGQTHTATYDASVISPCIGGCFNVSDSTINFWEYPPDTTIYKEAEWITTGASCEIGEPSQPSGDNAGSEIPTGENGEPCTGDYYSNASGGTTCGSPDDGTDPTDPDPVTPDNSCISNPASCTDTDGDGTPDTPTQCTVAGSNCTDTNGDGQPDTPSDTGGDDGGTGGDTGSGSGDGVGGDNSNCTTGSNSDGSCDGDGDPDTVPDGHGSECRAVTTSYDGVCPSGSSDDGCPSKTYTLVNGVSVCSDHAGTPDGDGNEDGEGSMQDLIDSQKTEAVLIIPNSDDRGDYSAATDQAVIDLETVKVELEAVLAEIETEVSEIFSLSLSSGGSINSINDSIRGVSVEFNPLFKYPELVSILAAVIMLMAAYISVQIILE